MNHAEKNNIPFFLVGCVRSGTTMLRDFLRLHPRLECPEETHFYRWPDPYGSPRYNKNYISMKIFKDHRKLDGVTNEAFFNASHAACDRKELSEKYAEIYLQSVGNPEGRWFDKTPQNVYGIFLTAHQFPESQFVHIHRHPLNVVSSLVEGRVMAKHSVKAGINYWMESMILIQQFKKIYPERLHEIPYEAICSQPVEELRKLMNFLGEDFDVIEQSAIRTHPEKNKFKSILSDTEIREVQDRTKEFLAEYNYSQNPVDSLI